MHDDIVGALDSDRTRGGMFAVDGQGTVLSWNPGAEVLLGYRADEAIGRKCYELLDGRLRSGKRLCASRCVARACTNRTAGIRDMDLVVQHRGGRREVLRVSTVTLPDHGGGAAHFIRPAASEWNRRTAGVRLTSDNLSAVSRREADVLRGLANGRSTHDIATDLCISPLTVRTHLRNLLRKLNLRSQTQLALFALRNGLS